MGQRACIPRIGNRLRVHVQTEFSMVQDARVGILRGVSHGEETTDVILEERLRSHYESLARVIRFTRTADSKAAPVLALQIALVGTLASQFENLVTIVTGGQWDVERCLIIVVMIAYVAFGMAAAVMAAWVYMPISPRTGKSLIFFEDIAAMDLESFEQRVKAVSIDDIECQLLDQIHRVSKIASVKMRRVRRALWLSVPSIILWLVLLAWSNV